MELAKSAIVWYFQRHLYETQENTYYSDFCIYLALGRKGMVYETDHCDCGHYIVKFRSRESKMSLNNVEIRSMCIGTLPTLSVSM
jgi:hypothetical protein